MSSRRLVEREELGVASEVVREPDVRQHDDRGPDLPRGEQARVDLVDLQLAQQVLRAIPPAVVEDQDVVDRVDAVGNESQEEPWLPDLLRNGSGLGRRGAEGAVTSLVDFHAAGGQGRELPGLPASASCTTAPAAASRRASGTTPAAVSGGRTADHAPAPPCPRSSARASPAPGPRSARSSRAAGGRGLSTRTRCRSGSRGTGRARARRSNRGSRRPRGASSRSADPALRRMGLPGDVLTKHGPDVLTHGAFRSSRARACIVDLTPVSPGHFRQAHEPVRDHVGRQEPCAVGAEVEVARARSAPAPGRRPTSAPSPRPTRPPRPRRDRDGSRGQLRSRPARCGSPGASPAGPPVPRTAARRSGSRTTRSPVR